MGSREWEWVFVFLLSTPHSPLPESGFYKSVIPVLAFINYADAIGLRVPENQKVFGRLADMHHGLFGGHRFDRITPRANDVRAVSLRFDRRNGAWRYDARRRRTVFAGDDFPLHFERLTSQTVHSLGRRKIHIVRVG